jgi:sortase A
VAATLTPLSPDADDGSSGRRTPRRVLRLVGVRRSEPSPSPAAAPEPARPARPVTTARVVAGGLFLVTGLVFAFAAYLVVGSSLVANRAQDVMYNKLRTDLALATVPVSGPIAPGTSLGVVRIPEIGLDQVFVEGSSSEQTRTGPGLKTDSVLPGQTGISVLVGHRSTSGAAFAHLDQLRPGDRIEVATGQGRFVYVVDLVRTSDAAGSQVRVVPSRLTMVTSDPAYTPDRTLMVSARLQGKPLPASTGTTAPPADQSGHGSTARLVPLLLWSQLLLVSTLVVTWAALRMPRRGLWIGATPVLLAILWQVFENLAVLLPNTL